MKTKVDKKIISGLIISLMSTQMMQAIAQTVVNQPMPSTQPGVSTQPSGSGAATAPTIPPLPKLTILDHTKAPPGCNKEIMQNLNSQYLQTRGIARITQYNNQMNGLVMTTPKANQMDCFQQAMQNIKNLMTAINSIVAMFSGKIDMDAIMQQMVQMVLKAACQEINQVTGKVSSSLNEYTNDINGNLGEFNNQQIGNGPVSSTVGGIISTGKGTTPVAPIDYVGGSVSGITGTFNSVGNTVGAVNTTGSTIVDKVQSVNPFNSGKK